MKQLNWYLIFGNTHKIPDGRTVTPTDNIQIWLHCADIWDKAYTTLYEVLNDTDTLSALMASDNAVDYLVRSTSWAVPISVPIMTSNTTPSGVCIASSEDYPAYYAFNGNTSNGWASVTAGTSNLGRIGYEFTEAVDIKKVSLLHGNNANFTCKVQYSDDGVNWTDVEDSTFTAVKNTQANVSFNAGSHLYWAVYYLSASATTRASVNELQFYSASVTTSADAMTYIGQNNYCANTLLADATWCEAICGSEYAKSVFNIYVPIMTDNTHPSGVASASSIYAGDVSNYGAWRAFDGNDVGGTPLASTQQASHGWLQYQFTEPVIIKAVHYKGQDNGLWASRNPSGYLQGSNDGVTFDNIKAINYRSAQVVDDAIENTNSYDRYRLYNSSSSSEYLTAATIQFYGRKDV